MLNFISEEQILTFVFEDILLNATDAEQRSENGKINYFCAKAKGVGSFTIDTKSLSIQDEEGDICLNISAPFIKDILDEIDAEYCED